MKFIDYNNSIVGIPNSVLKYFGLKPLNSTDSIVDKFLNKNKPKNVVVILCDGMGHNTLAKFLSQNDFLLKNEKKILSSVFPTTTVAATTSMITGLYPNQHCWLGWDNYIAEIDKVVTMFLNKEKDTENFLEKNLCKNIFPYRTIFEHLKEAKVKTNFVSPYGNIKYKSFDEMCEIILRICKNSKPSFTYAYYENPDLLLHKYGVNSIEVSENIKFINSKLCELANKSSDTIFIVTADHGLTPNEYIYVEDDIELLECTKHTTSIDSRASMFFIKEGYENKFKNIFCERYSSDFILLTKDEIIKNNLFGLGNNHIKFESCLGDFIVIAISNKSIKYKRSDKLLLANHSGLTEDEIDVPLILFKS